MTELDWPETPCSLLQRHTTLSLHSHLSASTVKSLKWAPTFCHISIGDTETTGQGFMTQQEQQLEMSAEDTFSSASQEKCKLEKLVCICVN